MDEEELNTSVLSEENENDKELPTKHKTSSNLSKKRINSIKFDSTKKTKPINNTETRVSIRFSGPDDVALYSRWKKKIESQGISAYSALNHLVKNELLKKEQEVIVRDTKYEMFIAFRKAIWSSIFNLSSIIKEEMNRVKIEQSVISQKLNLIINVLCKNDAFEQLLSKPSNEYLTEIPYFENETRKILNAKKDEFTKALENRIANSETTIEKFLAQLGDNEFDKLMQEYISSEFKK